MAADYKPQEYKRQMDAQLINELRAQRDEHNRYFERFDRILDIMSDLLQENKQHMKRYEKQEEIIFGKNGLVIEVDRLIQDNKKSKWFWALSIAVFLEAVIAAILKSLGMKFLFAIVLLLSSDLVFAQTSCLWCPSSPLLDRVMVGNGGRWQSKLLPSNCTIQWDPVTREFGCGSGGAPSNATYVVMSLDATLTNERVLTAGSGLDLTDGGAGGSATLLLEPIGPQTVLGNPLGGAGSPTAVGLTGGLDISGGNLQITNNGVTDAKLRDSGGNSVIGRSAASSGDPADITASLVGQVLRLSGTTLAFGAVNLADTDAVTGLLPAGNFEGYDRVQDETSDLTRRRTVNFTGAGVTCADNAGTTATDCTISSGGGGCPWTYVVLGSDFSTTNATPTSVTGLNFTPVANSHYVIEGQLYLQSTSATVGSRPGIDWPSAGITDNVGWMQASETGVLDNRRYWDGTATNAANTASVPTVNVSTFGVVNASMRVGGSPSGTFQITLESETAGTSVSMRTGSWIRYKVIVNGAESCGGTNHNLVSTTHPDTTTETLHYSDTLYYDGDTWEIEKFENVIRVKEDFIGCREISSTNFACNYAWEQSIQNSAVIDWGSPGENNRLGQINITTSGPGTNGRAGFSMGPGFSTSADWVFGGGYIEARFGFRTFDLSDGTNRYAIRVGFQNNYGTQTSSTPGTVGAWIEYEDDRNGGEWECKTVDAATSTVDSNVLVAANTFYDIIIKVAADASSVIFNINGSDVCTISTVGNIPDGVADLMAPGFFIGKSLGTSDRRIKADYTEILMVLTTPR